VSGTPIAEGMRRRRSLPSVTNEAPTKRELLPLIEAAASVADHASLRPWRLIALRGSARERLGQAIVEATGLEGGAAEKMAAKPLRAPLLIAIVASPKPSHKVPEWEQEAVAAGVAHALSLVLDEAGWGVIWRTGHYTRSAAVHRMHDLAPEERLLGWLYVGGRHKQKSGRRKPVKARDLLTTL
jgi:nitroreductase